MTTKLLLLKNFGIGFASLFTVWLICGSFVAYSQPQYSTNFSSAPTQSSIPFNSSLNNKAQWVYLHSDFATAPSGFINQIYFKSAPSPLPVICSFSDFTVKMGQSNLSMLPPGPWTTFNMNTVFQLNTFNVWPLPGDWIPVTLQTPFYYDNTTNFIVEASQTSYAVGFDVMQGNFSARSLYGNISSIMGNSQNYLCDFGFDIAQASTDASLEGYINIVDTICGGTKPVVVTLKNNGPVVMTSVSINWKVNNQLQPVFNWTGSLAVNATTTVTLGNYNFQPLTSYILMAFSSNPNNLPDNNFTNDTAAIFINHVKQNPMATPVSGIYMVCPGDTALVNVNLLGTPPWNLTLYNGSNTFTYSNILVSPLTLSLSPIGNTTYTVTSITDASACPAIGQASFQIQLLPAVNINLGPDQAIKYTQSTTLSAGSGFATYVWSTGANTSSILVSGSQLGLGTHQFSVTVTNINGCSDADTILVTVIDDVGTGELEADQKLLITPNPTDGRVELSLIRFPAGMINVELYTLAGKLISRSEYMLNTGNEKIMMDFSEVPPGLYILKVAGGDTTTTRKLVRSE